VVSGTLPQPSPDRRRRVDDLAHREARVVGVEDDIACSVHRAACRVAFRRRRTSRRSSRSRRRRRPAGGARSRRRASRARGRAGACRRGRRASRSRCRGVVLRFVICASRRRPEIHVSAARSIHPEPSTIRCRRRVRRDRLVGRTSATQTQDVWAKVSPKCLSWSSEAICARPPWIAAKWTAAHRPERRREARCPRSRPRSCVVLEGVVPARVGRAKRRDRRARVSLRSVYAAWLVARYAPSRRTSPVRTGRPFKARAGCRATAPRRCTAREPAHSPGSSAHTPSSDSVLVEVARVPCG